MCNVVAINGENWLMQPSGLLLLLQLLLACVRNNKLTSQLTIQIWYSRSYIIKSLCITLNIYGHNWSWETFKNIYGFQQHRRLNDWTNGRTLPLSFFIPIYIWFFSMLRHQCAQWINRNLWASKEATFSASLLIFYLLPELWTSCCCCCCVWGEILSFRRGFRRNRRSS